jgi:hypothetical protein
MCYSLSASISAGVGLGVVGSLLVRRAKLHDQRMIVYAYFPLVYSVHQLIEAVNWYAIEKPFYGDVVFRYLYSIIAFGFWPILIPLAAAIAEQRCFWRKIWWLAVVGGVALSGYLWTKLAFAGGIDVSVVKHSLAYKPLFDDPPLAISAAYVAATTFPSILLRNAAVNIFGWLVFASFFVSIIGSAAAWYSVWCMIAAASSLSMIFAIKPTPFAGTSFLGETDE